MRRRQRQTAATAVSPLEPLSWLDGLDDLSPRTLGRLHTFLRENEPLDREAFRRYAESLQECEHREAVRPWTIAAIEAAAVANEAACVAFEGLPYRRRTIEEFRRLWR